VLRRNGRCAAWLQTMGSIPCPPAFRADGRPSGRWQWVACRGEAWCVSAVGAVRERPLHRKVLLHTAIRPTVCGHNATGEACLAPADTPRRNRCCRERSVAQTASHARLQSAVGAGLRPARQALAVCLRGVRLPRTRCPGLVQGHAAACPRGGGDTSGWGKSGDTNLPPPAARPPHGVPAFRPGQAPGVWQRAPMPACNRR